MSAHSPNGNPNNLNTAAMRWLGKNKYLENQKIVNGRGKIM